MRFTFIYDFILFIFFQLYKFWTLSKFEILGSTSFLSLILLQMNICPPAGHIDRSYLF